MKRLDELWYASSFTSLLLAPLGWLFCFLATLRRMAYRLGLLTIQRMPVPVIVVGNITVGGTGKTPLVAWLARFLKQVGYTPGIVSRGYGGRNENRVQTVGSDSDPAMAGDEAILLARRSGCRVVVGADRVAAARALLEQGYCDVIISDDGLQHFRLGRDVEIAVIDGVRRLGNRRCLPAGPLREPVRRLRHVDIVVVNGAREEGAYSMHLTGFEAVNLLDEGLSRPLAEFRGDEVHAVAGIGNPVRFFSQLRENGLHAVEHPFPDHYPYQPVDLAFTDGRPLLMTEKDAVKCRGFAQSHFWYVPVEARLDKGFGERVLALLKRNNDG